MCLLIYFYFKHLSVYLHVHKQTTYMPGACGGKVSVLSYHMHPGNRTLGPQQVPPVFLTDKPSLQPYKGYYLTTAVSSRKWEITSNIRIYIKYSNTC